MEPADILLIISLITYRRPRVVPGLGSHLFAPREPWKSLTAVRLRSASCALPLFTSINRFESTPVTMPNGISKRQQLRNEKALAELVRSVPGNDRCADCEALTPGLSLFSPES